jgi:hypothetical protein
MQTNHIVYWSDQSNQRANNQMQEENLLAIKRFLIENIDLDSVWY